MPPSDTSDAAARRYLTRLLCALTLEAGGELRIPLRRIRELELESSRQMLAEDTDVKHDQLVLRFGTKHSAVYPVEPECPTTQPRATSPTVQTTSSVPPSQPIRSAPKSPEELLRLEKNVRARRVAAQLARERAQEHEQERRDLSDILGPNSTS